MHKGGDALNGHLRFGRARSKLDVGEEMNFEMNGKNPLLNAKPA